MITIRDSGQAGERVDVLITKVPDGAQVYKNSGTLDQGGSGSLTVPLSRGTYTVTVTAYPGGAPICYTQQVDVTD